MVKDTLLKRDISKKMKTSEVVTVLGPNVYYYYEILGKRIHLFGETHVGDESLNEELVCKRNKYALPFAQFLVEIVNRNPQTTFDMFLEIPYFQEKVDLPQKWDLDSINSPTVVDIYKTMKGCFTVAKNCIFPNFRGHYVDFRRYYCNNDELNEATYITDLVADPADTLVEEVRLKFNNSKILKQYENIKSPALKKELLDYFEAKFFQFSEEFRYFFYDFYRNPKNKRKGEIANNIYGTLKTLILDKYMMGRLFRDFKDYKATDVIIYTGSLHTETYVELFNYMGYQPIIESGSEAETSKKNYCVDVDLNDF